MPKIVTEEEKQRVKDEMYSETIQLIKTKGIKKITVEDIIQAVGIAKGTFYNHYSSKEALLFHVIQKSEETLLNEVLAIDYQNGDFHKKIQWALREIYLAPSSIALYIQPEDLSSLMVKLPKQTQAVFEEKQQRNFQRITELFALDPKDSHVFGVVSYLMDCLHFTATNIDYGDQARQASLDILINTIADFLTKKQKQKRRDE